MTEIHYLLDSNIISEVIKKKPEIKILEKLIEHSTDCGMSIFTFHEMLYGVERLPESYRQNELLKFINEDVYNNFPIITYDENAARIHAKLRAFLESEGIILPYGDTQIAASAIAENLTLVTRNLKHFSPLCQAFDLKLENWFE